ncbi:MAG: iron-sulfur cluster repair di-iron protein [Bacteroidota bacterium]|nr:iron-sulfur cluster repair di-iron protein [Bacteroidota bacterium]MDX5429792.1 iron-sulfur cluster repair di-iron protein [Bacteroidota bacterium]MDX5468571.1 iron-sulfur cluster repair di-iron protein [Bacteroidota bacterium]
MQINKTTQIGELVARNYRSASVFKKYGIDFCCQGKRSIEEACTKEEKPMEEIIRALEDSFKNPSSSSEDFATWPLDLLVDMIEKKHHRYVRTQTSEIQGYLIKICRVHGERHPELFEIAELFLASAEDLEAHMQLEESLLFPYIRNMVNNQAQDIPLPASVFGSIKYPIEKMNQDHLDEGERFRQIEQLSQMYTAPEDACNTYRVAFALLKAFEENLHLHIHLENNILFPRSIEFEQQCKSVR